MIARGTLLRKNLKKGCYWEGLHIRYAHKYVRTSTKHFMIQCRDLCIISDQVKTVHQQHVYFTIHQRSNSLIPNSGLRLKRYPQVECCVHLTATRLENTNTVRVPIVGRISLQTYYSGMSSKADMPESMLLISDMFGHGPVLYILADILTVALTATLHGTLRFD